MYTHELSCCLRARVATRRQLGMHAGGIVSASLGEGFLEFAFGLLAAR
jgi:hypothetical protein